VLFISTISLGKEPGEVIMKNHKRPSNLTKFVTSEWGDLITKMMPVLDFIDSYNHKMNGVDLADQMRMKYHFSR
jgi:hypothetical protein